MILLYLFIMFFFFFNQKTAYEMRISDWCSDVCSSDLGQPSPRLLKESAVAYEIEQISEDLVRVFVAPPIQFALHVEDERDIHLVGHRPTSCLLAVSTAPLRHVDGFPVLGLLRRLRPSSSRSLVASAIRGPTISEATTRFLGSVTDLWPAVGADFTPCGIGSRYRASPYRGWRAARRTPPVRVSIARTNAPQIPGSHRRLTHPLPLWRRPAPRRAGQDGLRIYIYSWPR